MIKLYIPSVVADLQGYYGEFLLDIGRFDSVASHLSTLATKLWDGLGEGHDCLWTEINNHHPDFLGVPKDQLCKLSWTLEDARWVIAKEYGFPHWEAAMEVNQAYNDTFEGAVRSLLTAPIEGFEAYIIANPDVVSEKSQYGHGASLLHYAGSNGVEMWRQQVPLDLPDRVAILRNHGADLGATMQVYGGTHTTYALAESSAHPADAGIRTELLAALS